jgi:hypothetical protein
MYFHLPALISDPLLNKVCLNFDIFLKNTKSKVLDEKAAKTDE